MLLRGALINRAVRHAVCAFGAFHQYLLGDSITARSDAYLLATQQYDKAIQYALKSTRRKKISVDESLINCILFTLLERHLGTIKAAATLFYSGTRLLLEHSSTSMPHKQHIEFSEEETFMPRNTIDVLLERIERQLYEIGHVRLESEPSPWPSSTLDASMTIDDLESACASFEHHFNHIFRRMHTCEWNQTRGQQALKPAEASTTDSFRRILQQWTQAFLTHLHSREVDGDRLSEEEQLIVHSLHLYRLVLATSLAHYETSDEMICDKFLDEYTEAVIHGAAIIRIRQPKNSQAASSQLGSAGSNTAKKAFIDLDTFRAECSCDVSPLTKRYPPGVDRHLQLAHREKAVISFSPFSPVTPLSVIAFRCRDPIIRRYAIQILREINWYDGFSDSKISALLVECIVEIEENQYLMGYEHARQCPVIERAEQIPSSARCKQIRVQFENPRLMICDWINIDAQDWVPGPDFWEDSASTSFWRNGMIRETWVVDECSGNGS